MPQLNIDPMSIGNAPDWASSSVYRVTVKSTRTYHVDVLAHNQEDAKDRALGMADYSMAHHQPHTDGIFYECLDEALKCALLGEVSYPDREDEEERKVK